MSCEHRLPQFGCNHCLEKRGPIFDSEIDYHAHQLQGIRDRVCKVYEDEDTEKAFDVLDTAIDEIEEIIRYVQHKAKTNSSQGLFHSFIPTSSGSNSNDDRDPESPKPQYMG